MYPWTLVLGLDDLDKRFDFRGDRQCDNTQLVIGPLLMS